MMQFEGKLMKWYQAKLAHILDPQIHALEKETSKGLLIQSILKIRKNHLDLYLENLDNEVNISTFQKFKHIREFSQVIGRKMVEIKVKYKKEEQEKMRQLEGEIKRGLLFKVDEIDNSEKMLDNY